MFAKRPEPTAAAAPIADQLSLLQTALQRHLARMQEVNAATHDQLRAEMRAVTEQLQARTPTDLMTAWTEYVTDAAERSTLTLDALRQRGDVFLDHEAAGNPPVLIYDYEVVVDGKDLARPSNYMLLRIKPDSFDIEVKDWKRPYVIIDPRAGHGPGIGGFKPDSQVGVALSDGHPVYFVAFRPVPEPGQTLADVTHSEAAFLRYVRDHHRDAPNPIVVGNCQGGWATAILAATNPDLTGPIVLNGAPMSYWSGRLGQDPMRYTGGNVGGVLPVLALADLNGGRFDGANLVLNFETLNPGRTWFRKYYDLYANVDTGVGRFLEFERWWGGFFLMNEAEMRWIVENLFIGNRLGKNEARLETGRPIDLKHIKAPIIVFASHGDNITPPQQALNWIVDTYTDETEIEVLGQRVLYMVHEEVGHLGIFVSSAVAKREHSQMASTLKTIEALPPGLYEMIIEDVQGDGHGKRFTVRFDRRKMADILSIGDGRHEEPAFAAVARLSEQLAESYETFLRPVMQQMSTPDIASMAKTLHPMRAQRSIFASTNPAMSGIAKRADDVRNDRHPVSQDNPFLLTERLWADAIEAQMNFATSARGMLAEMTFLWMYAGPWGQWYGRKNIGKRIRKSADELRALPPVAEALARLEQGGFAEAVVRMLILLANARGNVRKDRLDRSAQLMHEQEPFASMAAGERAHLIHAQDLCVRFEPDAALAALPKLLRTAEERRRAFDLVKYVVGDESEMEPASKALFTGMRDQLNAAPRTIGAAAE
ncbi:MAG: DUF3141 domain-containing protein [Pseudomonadota bacterium]